MMIVTLQTRSELPVIRWVSGDIVKLEMGALMIEMDTSTFKSIMGDLFHQARDHQIFIPLMIGEGRRTGRDNQGKNETTKPT